MTLHTRRYLYLVFIAAFAIITPLIIFYANGYQFNFSQNQVIKIGMLILDTQPSGAKVFLNDQPQQTFINQLFNQKAFVSTPIKIKNLVPGDYEVKLEKSGYWPWLKKLTVNPGESTYAEDVILFLKTEPKKLFDFAAKHLIPSPNNNTLAFFDGKILKLLDEKNSDQTTSINQAGKTVSWSSDGSYLLLDKKIYKAGDSKIFYDLQKATVSSIDKITWDQSNANLLYFVTKNALANLDLNSLQITSFTDSNFDELDKLISKPNIPGYLIKNNYLDLIENSDSASQFKVFDLTTGKLLRSISLPENSSYRFINPLNDLINLYNPDFNSLYLIDPLNFNPLVYTLNNFNNGYWIDNNRLLYQNDHEISIFNLNLKTETLFTRVSDQLIDVFWHPSNNYIIYATSNAIFSFELDPREKHYTLKLASADNISAASLNTKGDALYFSGSLDHVAGIYKLQLQ